MPLTAKQVSEFRPGGRDPKFAADRTDRWTKNGVFKPIGETIVHGGRAWLYSDSTPALAQILFYCFDFLGLTCWLALSDLREAWERKDSDGTSLLDRTLAGLADGEDLLCSVTRYIERAGFEAVTMTVEPAANWRPTPPADLAGMSFYATHLIPLAPMLERYVGRNVLAFKPKADA